MVRLPAGLGLALGLANPMDRFAFHPPAAVTSLTLTLTLTLT